jgi:hypothetical protein
MSGVWLIKSPVVAGKPPRKGRSEGMMLYSLTRRVNQQWEEPMSGATPSAAILRRYGHTREGCYRFRRRAWTACARSERGDCRSGRAGPELREAVRQAASAAAGSDCSYARRTFSIKRRQRHDWRPNDRIAHNKSARAAISATKPPMPSRFRTSCMETGFLCSPFRGPIIAAASCGSSSVWERVCVFPGRGSRLRPRAHSRNGPRASW